MTRPPKRTIHAPTLPTWHVATSDAVRTILANAYATDEPPTTIGDVTLMPHQRHALARVRNTIREFHGALLADEVGLGKTYVALALAHDYRHTHVIAPAALVPMWRAAVARTAAKHVELHSLHAFSRPPGANTSTGSDRDSGTPRARNTLVIIDEAHHLRTRNTRRYRAIADFVVGRDVLLLSATPIHNTTRELRHVLALFAGSRDDLLDPESLARLIVRHTVASTGKDATRARHIAPPGVCEHPPIPIPHDRATLDGILALPSPLPAHDGAVAGALIRLGMLRAWCSSDAALTHVIQRRLLRGEALKQALVAGRHPTQAELRTWLVGEHEVQLAFPELLTTHATESGPLLEVLARHLDALEALLDHQRRHRIGDTPRAAALRDIVAKHPGTPVIAFSQFTRTVQSLYRALSDIAGVGALTGMHAHIASGRIARLDAIARFAPSAQGRPPPPPHQAIRLLLATDILAEGVNLQDAGVVVHLDLPWTDALRHQRVGRVARIGSLHHLVHVYSLAPHPAGDRALALTARLLTKATLTTTFIGKSQTPTPPSPVPATAARKHVPPNSIARLDTEPLSPADLATFLHAEFQRWRNAAPQHHTRSLGPSTQFPPTGSIPVAGVASSRSGWIAAISTANGPQLIAHTTDTTTDPARIRQLVTSVRHDRQSSHATVRELDLERARPAHYKPIREFLDATKSAPPSVSALPLTGPLRTRYINTALRQLLRFLADRDIAHALGPTPATGSRAQTLARQRLAQLVSAAPPLTRRVLADSILAAERVIASATGIGAESALENWSRQQLTVRPTVPALMSESAEQIREWLAGWKSHAALRRVDALAVRDETRDAPESSTGMASTGAAPMAPQAPVILALLLFRTPPR